MDTLRADYLGSYGHKGGQSPVMDILAKRGVRFSRCRTTSPWTLPAHASLFTGLYPTDHRAVDDKTKIRPDAPMLTEGLKEAGYRTAAFVTHYYVGRDYGFARGFDDFRLQQNAPADLVADMAVRWLKKNHRRPFFLFLHFFDPHTPYDPPPSIRQKRIPKTDFPVRGDTKDVLDVVLGRHGPRTEAMLEALRSLYAGEIERVDRALGRVLAFMRRLEMKNTIVILVADHGEEFFEHGLMEHGFTLYEEQLRVPLLIYWPEKLAAGKVADAPVSLIDLAPTIAEMAGLDTVVGGPGRSLLPLMRGEITEGQTRFFRERALLAETSRQGPDRVCLIRDNMKYLYSPIFRLSGRVIGPELYDLSQDPGERNNLIESAPSMAKAMLKAIAKTRLYVRKRLFSLVFAGAGEGTRVMGTLKTGGVFVSVYKDNVIYDTDADRRMVSLEYGLKKEESRLHFLSPASQGANGLHFIQEPENAPIMLDLLVNDTRDASKIFIGDESRHPDAIPFAMPKDLAGTRRFPSEAGFRLWCREILASRHVVSRFEIGDQIEMSAEMKATLRSLGYLDDGESIPRGSTASSPKEKLGKLPRESVEYRCTPLELGSEAGP